VHEFSHGERQKKKRMKLNAQSINGKMSKVGQLCEYVYVEGYTYEIK
jgi:hypothetical protein